MRIDGTFKLLDLYCGEGLAAWGYWSSGRFSEIVGIDLDGSMRKHYSFDFIEGDALALDYKFLSQFDFIHASPPCQAYSKQTPPQYRGNHKRLIDKTHLMLHATNLPYVIENVEGSSKELRPNIVLSGHSLGLPINRRRYFHASTLEHPIRKISSLSISNQIHKSMRRDQIVKYLGLNLISPNALKRMTINGMLQGIPPIMTNFISHQLLPTKIMIGAC